MMMMCVGMCKSSVNGFHHLLAVIEMMLHTLDLLIILMPLSGYEYHGAGAGKGHGGAYGLTAVGDVQCAGARLVIEAGFHVGEDGLGLLKSRIVRGKDHAL